MHLGCSTYKIQESPASSIVCLKDGHIHTNLRLRIVFVFHRSRRLRPSVQRRPPQRENRGSQTAAAPPAGQCRETIPGERDFQAEATIIARVHHRHLVQLVGFCTTAQERILVLEYMPNGSLADNLYGERLDLLISSNATRSQTRRLGAILITGRGKRLVVESMPNGSLGEGFVQSVSRFAKRPVKNIVRSAKVFFDRWAGSVHEVRFVASRNGFSLATPSAKLTRCYSK
jgi:serine/threonine protein kinase